MLISKSSGVATTKIKKGNYFLVSALTFWRKKLLICECEVSANVSSEFFYTAVLKENKFLEKTNTQCSKIENSAI